jgi:DNA-binding NtrC family response regulator
VIHVKILIVFLTRSLERLGGTRLVPVNVRVLAGTKRDLRQLVAEGRFREDLYYRLNVLPLTLPPLRERPEDIPPLMEAFLERFFSRRGDPPPALSPAVVHAFTAYSWPGNVRELENACERIAQMNTCGEIRVGCVAASLLLRAAEQSQPVPQPPVSTVSSGAISLDDRLREFESTLIRWALDTSHGNKSKAAALLKVKRSTLGDRIRHCGLDAAPPVEESCSA